MRYDIRINEDHDFLNDEEFWNKEEEHPADVYHFAIPCDNFSIAHTTPHKVRTLASPLGWSNDTEQANRIMRLMIRRIQRLASKGVCIIVENPLMSYLWKIDEMQGLIGSPGFSLTRIDHCTYGTPYQKGQIWASNCPKLSSAAGVCTHREPHPVRLEGAWARRSAPYPRELAMAVVQSLIAEFLETGRFSSELSAPAMQSHLFEESVRPAPGRRSHGKQARSGDQRRIPVRGQWLTWAHIGDTYIEHCKKGNLSSESIDHSIAKSWGCSRTG